MSEFSESKKQELNKIEEIHNMIAIWDVGTYNYRIEKATFVSHIRRK